MPPTIFSRYTAAMPYDPPPNIQSLDLDALAKLVEDQSHPPVEQWDPQAESDSYMRITKDGRWYHQGEEIKREAMIRLFSSILRREEDGRYALVTPYEKQFIEVENTPFQAVEMSARATNGHYSLTFRLNTDDVVIAGADHPLRIIGSHHDPRFSLTVRPGLEAMLSRNATYQLANLLLDHPMGELRYFLDYGGGTLELDLSDMEDAS